MTILVFPSSMKASVTFAREARSWGRRTLGASSVAGDPNISFFDEWAPLPFIGDPSFFSKLQDLVQRRGITGVFSPHAPTFHLLAKELATHVPGLQLIGEGPFVTQMNGVKDQLSQAKAGMQTLADQFGKKPEFCAEFLAAILAKAETFHGECPQEKILALCGIVPLAPKGDIVEIGCLFGKSSFVLNKLAVHSAIGTTLCVDPWDLGLSIQHDAPLNIQNASEGWDWEIVYKGFLINMLGSGAAPVNYMRMTSVDAFAKYSLSNSVSSPEFGNTPLAGKISVLHLDGNHDEAAVQQDFDLWSQRLVPDGWIIFDDYNWAHGDGPQKVADRAVISYGGRVKQRFFAGGALFLNVDSNSKCNFP